MCQVSSKSNNFRGKRANEEKSGQSKTSRDVRPTLLPISKSWVMRNVGSWKFTFCLVTYLHYVWAKFHPSRTTFSVKGLASRKVAELKSTNFMRRSTDSASNQKTSAKGNVGSWKFTFCLVAYLQFVCAKFHPNRTTFSVKGLARRKVAQPEGTNFTRCETYSASNYNILSQEERRKLRLYM